MKFELYETNCDLGQGSVKGGPFGNLQYLSQIVTWQGGFHMINNY